MKHKKRKQKLSELNNGDFFILSHSYSDELFLVVSDCTNSNLRDTEFSVLAVSITGDYLREFKNDCEIKKVEI